MGSVHEELYARVKALFDQDLDATRGLSKSTSTAYCRGGMWRMGDPQRTMNRPWIEVRISVDEDLNSKDGSVFVCSVEMRTHGNRDHKFSGVSGDVALNMVAQRVREVYDNCPVEKGQAGYNYRISSFKRSSGTTSEVTDKEIVLADRFTVLVSDKDVNFFQVFNPGEKTFYRGGFASENRRYISLDASDIEAVPNNIPHVGWTDRLSIVRSVTRSRVFNRFDAEYYVKYEPLDFSFDEQQRRVEITTDTIVQEVPLFKRVRSQDPSGDFVSYIPQMYTFRRSTYTRTEQVKKDLGKSLNSDVLVPLMDQIATVTNTIAEIGGVPYLFLGANVEYNTNTGIAIVTAKFWTTGQVKAVPAESAQGVIYEVGLPMLDWLEDYIVTPPQPTASGGTTLPAIGRKNIADIYEVGDFSWL